jgi:hypothetical protein
MNDQGPGPTTQADAPAQSTASIEQIVGLLHNGRIKIEGLLPNSSNYTFLVTVKQPDLQCLAVYKPQRGERPLWDFPRGTLCLREYATFLVAMALGWVFVPPTVLRKGPHGLGALQLFIDAVPNANFFSLREQYAFVFQRLCAFDYIVNNADRKGGHCLLGKDGRIWAIDHGITFNADFKLRTVIWDWAGDPLPDDIVADLRNLRQTLSAGGTLTEAIGRLLSAAEIRAFHRRLDNLIEMGTFPQPHPDLPNIPWPLV